MDFNQIRDLELTEDQRNSFRRLKDAGDFVTFRKGVEEYIFKLNYNLLVGTETQPGSSVEALMMLRGFVKYWRKITNLIDGNNETELKKFS